MHVDVVAIWGNNIFKRVFFSYNIWKEVRVIAHVGHLSTDKSKKHLSLDKAGNPAA